MKPRKRWPKIGEVVHTSYAQDAAGHWWWAQTERPIRGWMDIRQFPQHGGPFRTRQEAEKNATDTPFGPQCKVLQAGMWEPERYEISPARLASRRALISKCFKAGQGQPSFSASPD